jgi:hypothetical protein
MEIFIVIVPMIFVALLFLTRGAGNKRRMAEISRFAEPMGFEVQSNLADSSSAYLHHHKPNMGLLMNIHAVCVADDGTTRIVVVEYHQGKGSYKQYFLGINAAISAPQLVIKRRTPSTKSIWTASFGDIMFDLGFKDDPEFEEKFIVRGDPDPAAAFLNPARRRILCEANNLPDSFSVYGKSVFFELPNKIDAATFEHNVGTCLATVNLMLDR